MFKQYISKILYAYNIPQTSEEKNIDFLLSQTKRVIRSPNKDSQWLKQATFNEIQSYSGPLQKHFINKLNALQDLETKIRIRAEKIEKINLGYYSGDLTTNYSR